MTFFASRARYFKEQTRESDSGTNPSVKTKPCTDPRRISFRPGLELPGSVPKGEPRADRNPTDRIGNINSELSFSIKYNPAAIGELDQLEAQPEMGAEAAFRCGAESHNQAPSSSAGIEAIWATVHSPGAVP